ncbi:MAG: DJ-1/PfpI family protein, partial [Bacillota bacterium]|nr:DJ-1/PfpI family protein [Bacillota bacterium]
MFYLFLVDRFEEIEALATVDILRRAGIEITTVGVGGKVITGSHGIPITADILENEVNLQNITGVILPGGPGGKNLESSEKVKETVLHCYKNNLWICAICMAPTILNHMNL